MIKSLTFTKRRLVALFFVALMLFGTSSQTMIAFAAPVSSGPSAADTTSAANNRPDSHKTSTTPSVGTINSASPPALSDLQPSKFTSAADAQPLRSNSGSSSASFLDQVAGAVNQQPLAPISDPKAKPTLTAHELVDARTATSSEYLNKDGTITKTNYFSSHFYHDNGSWKTIDNTLAEDTNAADSGNIFGKALGKAESLVSSPDAFQTQANSWIARFTPSDFDGGMVRIKQGSSQVGFSPVGANSVNPAVTTDANGQQTVTYSDLWNGVDVTYRVQSDEIKESIVIKNKGAASKVQFKMVGASLQKQNESSSPDKPRPAFTIQGALGDNFGIAPANVLLSHFGYVDDTAAGLNQNYSNNTLSVGVNSSYLQQLPDKAFPVVIDPSITSTFGTTGGGSYLSFESNNTMCNPSTCDLYAGGLYDTTSTWRDWRGALFASYSSMQQTGITLTAANLHLTGVNTVTGGTYNYQVGKASCLTGYNCMDSTTGDSANLTNASGDINVTNIYQSYISGGNWTGWLMLDGADGTGTTSMADFNPNSSYVTFTYTTMLAPPTFVSPISAELFTDPQPSFTLKPETNPNNSTALEYRFQITDGADTTGAFVTSTLNYSTAWIPPDGVLQNGSTYYVEAQSVDPSTGYTSVWSTPTPFKIDLREGQDKTQTYDAAGPAKVDLTTGNLQTSVTSHTTKALGGDMGINLNYTAPIKSRAGLTASYWNVASGYSGSTPTTAPNLTQVDQNINFNWNSGSPGPGINNTWFFTQWTGYITVPTTGTYYFGGLNDDNFSVTVNGTSVYSSAGCYTKPCYGSGISLTAGQTVPFKATYLQGTGSDYVWAYVKGPVGEQVVPQSWFQTGVRQVQQYGLTGQYYTYTDSGVSPTVGSGSNSLFLTRTDPVINFNWTGNVPVTNGPQADFLVRWTGFLTVPASGSYVFGSQSDDGSQITVNGTQVYSHWSDGSNTGYGTAATLTAGQSVPIEVDYYQHTGSDSMSLLVEPLGGASQVVPSNWLTPQAQTLPNGWGLGIDPDGTMPYTHLTANTNNIILADASGDTYDYLWNGSGYTAPANSHGFLLRNVDGSFTLQDSDGKTYIFDVSGNLSSVTSPTDDAHQTSLNYSFGPVNGSGPTSIQQITDATNTNRWMKVYYGGASQCGSAPSGFYAAATNVLCAAATNDGRTTYFYYDQYGNLAEVLQPGNAAAQYQYQAVLNPDSSVMGYQLVGVRDALANDAIVAGVRANDSTTLTQIAYDVLGRVSSVTLPAATTGASRLSRSYSYMPAAPTAIALNRYFTWTGPDHASLTRTVAPAGGYNLDYTLGYVNQTQVSGTIPLYSCLRGSDEFTSSDVNCESSATYDGLLGYVYPTAPSGISTAPLYRCIGTGGEYFDTHDPGCEGFTLWNLMGYLLTSPSTSTPTRTDVHVSGATEPKGYSEEVVYDNYLRTTQVYNNLGLATTNEWDPTQDLLYSQTNPEGLMTTTIYDDEGRPVTSYGPAPASDFNRWSTTLTNGQSMTEGQSLYSPDHRFQLAFQTDGNVVLSGPSGTMWSTGTSGQTATRLTMQSDGNLAEFNGGSMIGATGTGSAGPSTYLVVQNDGNVVMYNTAGAVWATNTGGTAPSPTPSSYETPLSAYTNQVARSDAAYDQNMTGLAVSYTAINEPVANRASLSGAPLLHSVNIASNGTMTHDWSTTAPVTTSSGNWGLSMTGTMRLPSTGNWLISPTQDGGLRMWIDGQLVIDNWRDNTTANTTKTESYTYNNATANAVHQVRIDYYHLAVTSDATFSLAMTPPSGSSTTSVASYFSPNYGLTTSATSYDATIGNTTATTDYGSNPSLGIPTSATVDPSGLNLTASSAYETPGTGYERQISTTSAGGSTTNYSYYAANDTATNPCVTGGTAAYQAGMLKTTADPSPDGGTTPGKSVTVVYDEAGRIVATKTNSDGWECKTYDARGRLTTDVVPAFNGNASRTTTYNYSVSGNPLVSSVTDGSGTVTTTIDLLDRTLSYTNNLGDTTTTAYDSIGRLQSQTSAIGTKTYTYDSYSRVTDEKLGTTDLAQSGYDSYGRLSTVTYASAGTMHQTIGYDTMTGAENSITYTTSDGTSVNDAVTLTQSGKVQYDVVSSGSSSLWYNYGYDHVDRLTSASVGANSYAYGFDTENSSCASGTNVNAGKSGNRTSQTINGVTTYYCYNDADQLVSSSDATASAAQYDAHGNTTQIGSGSAPLRLYYDSSDRNWGMVQYDGSGNGNATYYSQDALNRMYYREHDTISGWNWNMDGQYRYGYTSGSGGPAYVYNSAWQIIEEYVQLPGGAVITIRPQRTGGAPYYQLPSIHGDTLLLADGTGANMSNGNGPDSAFTYDPFGNALPGGATPNDTDYGSFGYKGAAMKVTETTLSLTPILMGARIYLPTLGRFASQDPIPGGNANTYAYALDPINFADLSGMSSGPCAIACFSSSEVSGMQSSTTATVQLTASVAKTSTVRVVITGLRAQAPAQHTATVQSASAPAVNHSIYMQPDIKAFTSNQPLFAGSTGDGGGSLLGSVVGVITSHQFIAAATGCGAGIAGEYAMAFAAALATGEAAGVGGAAVLVNACAVGAWEGYANTVIPYSGDAAGGVTNAKSFLDKFYEFAPKE